MTDTNIESKENPRNRDWEIELVHRLEEIFGEKNVERDFEGNDFWEGPRIGAPYFWIDVEYGDDASLEETLNRVDRSCDLERLRLAICQKPRGRPMVAMFFDDFLKLLTKCFKD